MFNRKPEPDPGLEAVIKDCERELTSSLSADSKEYKEALARYRELKVLQAEIKPKRVSQDTLVLAAANILGIILIVGHERANIVTSKALGFIKKLT